jgi:hypothetical protein
MKKLPNTKCGDYSIPVMTQKNKVCSNSNYALVAVIENKTLNECYQECKKHTDCFDIQWKHLATSECWLMRLGCETFTDEDNTFYYSVKILMTDTVSWNNRKNCASKCQNNSECFQFWMSEP